MKRALLTTLVCVLAAGHGLMQTRTTAADGPWAGWVQCQLTAQLNEPGRTYLNQQTHMWMLTAATATSGTDIKEYPATWTVAGGGTGQREDGNGRTVTDKWSTAGQPKATTVSFRVDLNGTLYIGLRGAQLSSVSATTGTSVAHSVKGNAPDQTTPIGLTVEEFRFPVIQGDGRNTNIVGSSPSTTIGSIAPGQPPRTVSTAACSWNLVRGGGTPPPPPSGRDTRDQTRPSGSLAGVTVPSATVEASPSPTTITATPAPLATASAGPAPTAITAIPAPLATATAGPNTSTSDTTSVATLNPVAAGPAPTGLAVSGSGVTAIVSWQTVVGAKSYVVTRWAQADPACCRTSSATLNTTSWTDAGLQWPGTYLYRVAVTYADGRVGSADVTFTRPTPRDPTGFSATDMGDGRVGLSWKEDVPGVNTYLIFGPGIGPQGLQTRGFIADLRGVPLGAHEWTIASVYSPGGALTPASSWPRARLTVGAHSGRYRVLVNSLQVNTDHIDDGPFKKDGKGDEVYVAAVVLSFDNYGQTSVANMPKTSVMGDVFGFPLRVQAGTASPTGGLRAGDIIPGNQVPTGNTGVPSPSALPLILYEGSLTDRGTPGQYAENLFIFLSVWEFQGDDAWFGEWVNGISSGLRSSAYVSPLKDPVVQQTLSSAELKVIPGGRFRTTISPAGDPDRPIGTYPPGVCVPQDPNIVYCDRRIVLSRAIIERALTQPPVGGMPPGVLAVPLFGHSNGAGYYTLYLRIERLP